VERVFLLIEEEMSEPPHRPHFHDMEELLGFENDNMWDATPLAYENSLVPRVGGVYSGSGLGFGALYWRPQFPIPSFDLEARGSVSLSRYRSYGVRFGKLRSQETQSALPTHLRRVPRYFFFYADVRYDRIRDDCKDYFPRTDPYAKTRSKFLLDQTLLNAVGGYRFGKHITTAARIGWNRPRLEAPRASRLVELARVFGMESLSETVPHSDYLEMGAAAALDLRDVSGNPNHGGFLGLSWQRRTALGIDPLAFDRFLLDARGYLSLGSPSRVLAVRAFGSFDDKVSGQTIPFYLQNTLGDSNTMRGFPLWWFRGEQLIQFSFEYRWEGAPGLELAVFYDAGQAFPSLDAITLGDLEDSYGFGVRFKTSGSVFLRFDIARSREAVRFLFSTDHPF
jgi:hypothetical protein